jgi:hypothetical protein
MFGNEEQCMQWAHDLRRLANLPAQADTECPQRAVRLVLELANLYDPQTPCLHFVAFKDQEQINRATRLFGKPDFVHRIWDVRAARGGEIALWDVVVFAQGTSADPPSPHSYDDSAFA